MGWVARAAWPAWVPACVPGVSRGHAEPQLPHPSLPQAEDVNIVNGVHELGHKWCAYPLTRARTGIDYAPPLCIYYPEPLPCAPRHVARTAASS